MLACLFQSLEDERMRNSLIFILFIMPLATGCKDKVERPTASHASTSQSAKQSDGSPDPPDDPAPKPQPGQITPERVAEIKASGRTGFWSQITEVCPRTWEETTLTWNISNEPVNRFVVYVVDKDGTEHHFGQGGAVGEKRTGPWLKPGLQFKLRSAGDKREVGVVEIGLKPEC